MLSTVPYKKFKNRVSRVFSKYQLLLNVNYLFYFSTFPLEKNTVSWQFQNKKIFQFANLLQLYMQRKYKTPRFCRKYATFFLKEKQKEKRK
jgi:hypothetical protein